jgi:hypothetical protein
LNHIPGVEVPPAPFAASGNRSIPGYDYQPRRQHFPARVTDADKAVEGTAGLDPLISFTAEGAGHLILLRKEDSGNRPIRLGNDPNSSFTHRIKADNPPAVLEGAIVLPAIVGIWISPIP